MLNKFIRISPYLFLLLAIMILPLAKIGVQYIHYVYIGLTILFLQPQLTKSLSLRKNIPVWFFILIVFGLSVITPLISSIDIRTVFESSLIYFLPPLFWILFLTRYPEFEFHSFLKFSVYIAFIISVLGFIQFFYSRTIFGLIPEIDYFNIDFTNDALVSRGSIFRVRSILPSSQIFGLYTSLSFCLSISLFKKKGISFFIINLPIFFASLLSGQRIVVLMYLIFFGWKIFVQSKNIFKSILYTVFFVSFILFALNIVDDILVGSGMASTRLFDIFNDFSYVVEYEQNSRWTQWIELVKTTNPILGHGIGYTNQRIEGIRLITSESYLIQLYLEGGIFLLLSFLIVLFNSIKMTLRYKFIYFDTALIIALAVSLIVVHSFMNPIFFVYWGIIIYPLFSKRTA